MGTMPLRRLLQSLCSNSCWNYAVFWKLRQQNQMRLVWEDGYFDTLKVQDYTVDMFSEINGKGLGETSSSNTYNGTLGGDAVELAVAYMSNFQYALGDGVIGDVAYTGKYSWVFAGLKSLGEFNTASVPEQADEWLLQFAAGVKTILLVPVIPDGVLQLGSLEDLPEDAQMANYIKDEFIAHQDFMSCPDAFTMNKQSPSQSPISLMLMKSFDGFPSFVADGKRTDNLVAIDDINWSNHNPLTKSLVTSPCDTWYSSHLAGMDIATSLQMGAIELQEALSHSTNLINSNIISDKPLRTEALMKQHLVSDDGSGLSFSKECELHKAISPALMRKSKGEEISSSSQTCNKSNRMFFHREDVQNLLGNVITGVNLGENSFSNLFGQFSFLATRENLNEKGGIEGDSSVIRNHVAAASFSRVKNHTDSCSPSGISYDGVVDELTEEKEPKSSYNVLHQTLSGTKGSKPSTVASKRKGKQKPRPRDRQLIQDRLKDLRELVPNGAKVGLSQTSLSFFCEMHYIVTKLSRNRIP